MPEQLAAQTTGIARAAARRWGTLAGLGAALAIACGDAAPEQPAPAAGLERPNVVLIVMDTVRRDHLSASGHGRPTSPFLERLAAQGRSYSNAYSTSTWTGPSHASLFTGLYPSGHGLHWENPKLSEEHPTLAQRLTEGGYRTAGINENSESAAFGLFQRGFEYLRNLDSNERTPQQVLSTFWATLSADDPRPFFVFVNLFAAHLPYNSSGRFFGSFADGAETDPMARVSPGRYLRGEVDYDEDELRRLADHYDAEIRYVDYVVGRMAELLIERELWEKTVFIVTSDHGENLGDHGLLDHQFALYDTTVRIPLIVRYPPLFPPGSVDPNPVQIHDLFPTILEIAGIESRDAVDGRSLLPGRTSPDRVVISESYEHAWFTDPRYKHLAQNPRVQRFKRRLRMVRRGDLKLIAASDGRHELYDLALDPDETTNVVDDDRYAESRAELFGLLTDRLGPFRPRSEDPDARERALDAETSEALKALGYL